MLVVPVTTAENNKKIYLPKGDWFNIYSDEKIAGEKAWAEDVPAWQIPVFIKASSIIPMQSIVQSAKEKPSDTLWLHIYNGKEKNSFVYYEDNGDGMTYTKGDYCKRVITFDPEQKQLLLQTQEGTYQSDFKKLQLVFHGFENGITDVSVNNGNKQPLQEGREKILDGLQYMADLYDPSFYASLRNAEQVSSQKTITIDNSMKAITVQWK
jgi:alpha-glucosidase